MKREMINYCLLCGYVGTDQLNRIVIPQPINESWNDLFDSLHLDNNDAMQSAVQQIQLTLKLLNDELEPMVADTFLQPLVNTTEPSNVTSLEQRRSHRMFTIDMSTQRKTGTDAKREFDRSHYGKRR